MVHGPENGPCYGFIDSFRLPCFCTEYDEQTPKFRNIVTVNLPEPEDAEAPQA
jgi:hypothetical protein